MPESPALFPEVRTLSIDIIRQLVGQLPDREWFDACQLPQSRGHIPSHVPHFMLEDVPVTRMHDHFAVLSRAESFGERGRLVLLTPVEIAASATLNEGQ